MLFEIISWLGTLFGVGVLFYMMLGPNKNKKSNGGKVDP
jgi:hypothetical protein